ncbi:MAG: ABC transporter ATP-binding protein [Chloroflexota bacterium]
MHRDPLLKIEDLIVEYPTLRGVARAVDRVSLSIASGEILGLAGESGCGKSTTAHAILRLIKPPGAIRAGKMAFNGQDIMALSPRELRAFRWRDISIVFQSAMSSLNPVISLGAQMVDAILAHQRVSRRQALERSAEMFRMVSIDPARLRSYPHQLSGGMKQRVVIAMALALNPKLLILDEPTTALDVVVQRDILQQVQDLQEKLGFSVLFITHDLSLLVEFATNIAVMYAGRVVELAPARELFLNPMHPYSVGLMNSFPSVSEDHQRLQGIPGTPPDLVTPPRGCRFNPRCSHCSTDNERLFALQTRTEPMLREVAPGHLVACHL